MEHIREDILATQGCYSALLQSCQLYEELYNVYQELERNITSSPTLIAQITERLKTVQQQSTAVDLDLVAQLTNEPELQTTNKQLLRRRERLLQKLMDQNQNLVKKAGNMKSHLQHEMNSMNTNRTAINGYKPIENGNKRLINNSF